MTEQNPTPPPRTTEPTGGPAPVPPVPVSYSTPGTTGYPGPYVGPEPDKDAKMWGMLAHISALIASVIGLSFVGPLVVWMMKKNEMPFVDDQGKEALNFQITVLIAVVVAAATICVGIGFILLPAIGLAALVLTIIAAIKANEGVAYRYPFAVRLVK